MNFQRSERTPKCSKLILWAKHSKISWNGPWFSGPCRQIFRGSPGVPSDFWKFNVAPVWNFKRSKMTPKSTNEFSGKFYADSWTFKNLWYLVSVYRPYLGQKLAAFDITPHFWIRGTWEKSGSFEHFAVSRSQAEQDKLKWALIFRPLQPNNFGVPLRYPQTFENSLLPPYVTSKGPKWHPSKSKKKLAVSFRLIYWHL